MGKERGYPLSHLEQGTQFCAWDTESKSDVKEYLTTDHQSWLGNMATPMGAELEKEGTRTWSLQGSWALTS